MEMFMRPRAIFKVSLPHSASLLGKHQSVGEGGRLAMDFAYRLPNSSMDTSAFGDANVDLPGVSWGLPALDSNEYSLPVIQMASDTRASKVIQSTDETEHDLPPVTLQDSVTPSSYQPLAIDVCLHQLPRYRMACWKALRHAKRGRVHRPNMQCYPKSHCHLHHHCKHGASGKKQI